MARERRSIIRTVARGINSNVSKAFNSISKRFGSSGKPRTQQPEDADDQLLAVILGQTLTGENKTKVEQLRNGVTPDKTLFSKITIISDYYKKLSEKEKREGDKHEIEKQQKTFLEKVTKFIESEGAKKFSNDFSKVIEGINTIVEYVKTKQSTENEESDEDDKQKSKEAQELFKIVIEGAEDTNEMLENLKTLAVDDQTYENITLLEQLTAPDGPIANIIENMKNLSEQANIVEGFKDFMKKLSEASDATKTAADKCDPKAAAQVMASFDSMKGILLVTVGVGLLLIAVGLLSQYLDYAGIILFTITLGGFLLALTWIFKTNMNDFELSIESAKAAIILVAGAALIMFLGSFIIEYVNIPNLGLFTITLSGFLLAIGEVLYWVGGNFDGLSKDVLWGLAIVAGSALIMFLGAAVIALLDYGQLVLFCATLAGFMWGIGRVLHWLGKKIGRFAKGLLYGMAVVAGSALIMFLGSAVIDLLEPGKLLIFTVTLGGFLWAIGKVLGKVGRQFNKIRRNALYALALVAGSALIMFLGAAVMDLIDAGNLILFVATLSAFLAVLGGIFLIFGNAFKESLPGARDAAILVTVCGGMLLIGGWVMEFIEPGNIILFTVLLGILLLGVSLSLKIIKNVTEMLEKAMGMSLIIVVAGGMILAGGMVMKYVNSIDVLAFIALTCAMIVAVGGALWLIGQMADGIKKGEDVMDELSQAIIVGSIGLAIIGLAVKLADGPIALGICVAGFVLAMWALGHLAMEFGVPGVAEMVKSGAVALCILAGSIVIGAAGFFLLAKAIREFATLPELNGEVLVNNVMAIVEMMIALAPMVLLAGPVAVVSGVALLLAKAIGKIAETISDVAGLKVAVDWSETGRPTKYKSLKESDFKDAATNTALLVNTLSLGIMKVYEKHKEWYNKPFSLNPFSGFSGQSPLERVISQSARLQVLLSSIAEGLKDYADLKFPIDWNKESGKAIKFKTFQNKDFTNAGNNIVKVVTTLIEGIMKIYTKHKDWYNSGISLGKFGFFNPLGLLGKSPLEKVIGTNSRLQKLLSSIAEGLKDYADLKFPIEWNKENGKPIKFKTFDNKDFTNAGKNIVKVVTTLIEGIMKVYDKHKDWYESGIGGFNPFGLFGKSPLEKVIGTNCKLQKLLSSIAEGLKDYADLKFPIDWNKENGKPIKFKTFENKDFENAGNNIIKVVTTLALGLMKVYQKNPTWFEKPIQWGIISAGDSPLVKVIKNTSKLSNLLSGLAEGIQAWADLKVATDWNKDNGKPIAFKSLDKDAPVKAAENAMGVVSALFEGLTKLYDGKKAEWFENEGGFLGIGSSSKISKVVKSTLKLSDLISGLAKGIQAWANLMVPDDWNHETGVPIHFSPLKGEVTPDGKMTGDFANAADNVKGIITALFNALYDLYNGRDGANAEWFQDTSLFGQIGIGSGSTKLTKVINTTIKLSDILSGIAKGLQQWAKLHIPKKWNKDGVPIEFDKMTPDDIDKAKKNVCDVISGMGEAMMSIYNDPNKQKWFEDNSLFGQIGLDMGASAFSKVVNTNLKLGELLKNLSEGLQAWALLKVPTGYDKDGKPTGYVSLDEKDYGPDGNAASNIKKVLTTLGQAIMEVYTLHDEWFEAEGLWGMISGSANTTPFMRVIAGNIRLGEMLKMISEGLQGYAKLEFVSKRDENGNPIDFNKLQEGDFGKIGDNIGKVLSALGKAMMDEYGRNPQNYEVELDDDGNVKGESKIALVINSNHKMGELIKNMAEGISAYASMDFAGATDNMTHDERAALATSTFAEASVNIGLVITTIGDALLQAYQSREDWFTEITEEAVEGDGIFTSGHVVQKGTGRTKFGNMIAAFGTMGQLISDVADGVNTYASGTYIGPDGKTHPINNATYTAAGNAIQEIIITIASAIWSVQDTMPDLFNGNIAKTKLGGKDGDTPFGIIVGSLNTMADFISNIAESISEYASNRIAIEWDSNGHPTKYHPLKDTDINNAIEQIGKIISTVGLAIGTAYKNSPDAFDTDWHGNSPSAAVAKSLNLTIPFIGKIANAIALFAKGEVLMWTGKKDKDGLNEYTPVKLNEKNIGNANARISSILITIGSTIGEVYKKNKDVFNFGNNSPAMSISKSLNVMGPIISNAAQYIGQFIQQYEEFKLGTVNLTSMSDNMAQILSHIARIYIILSSRSHDEYEKWNIPFGAEGGGFMTYGVDETFRTVIDRYADHVKEDSAALNLATKNVGIIMNNILFFARQYFSQEKTKTFLEAKENITNIIGGISSICFSLGVIMKELHNLNEGEKGSTSLLDTIFGNDVNVLGLKEFNNEAQGIMNNVDQAVKSMSFFVDKMNEILPKINELSSLSNGNAVTAMTPLLQSIYMFRYAADALVSNINSSGGLFKFFDKALTNLADINVTGLIGKVKTLGSAMTEIATASINAAKANSRGFSVLYLGITQLSSAINKISLKSLVTFKSQTSQLNKYVKTINSIKLTNLQTLYKFVSSLNQLANKMGNLDKLTEALGDKLAGELKTLSEQLQEAKNTIDRAERLQDKRHKAIKDSMKKIDNIMKQHMVVDINVGDVAKKK